jgi:O-antigen/teichoic acid export membrane protein
MSINNNTDKKLPLKVNFSWNFLGNIVFSFGQWAILAILTKLVIVEEVGNYSYAVAFTAPFVLFFQMQMRSIQITDTNDEYSFNDYFGARIISSITSLIFIIIMSLVFGNDIPMTILIASVTLLKLSDSISDIFYGLFQKHEYMKHIAISMIIKSIITVLFFFLVLRITKSIIISVLFITILKSLIIIIYDFYKARNYTKVNPVFNNYILIKLLKVSFPLGLMSLLISLDSNIPKYVIEHFEGVESLGYFSVLSYINMAGGQMITSISQASTPRLAVLYTYNNKKMFIRMLIKLTMIGFAIGVTSILFVLLFGEEFISILYSKEYANHMNVFITIMIAGAINYTASFLGNGMTAARAFKIQPFLGIIWVLTSLAISVVMVPTFGLLGGAIALVISAIVKLVSKAVVIFNIVKL